MSHTERKTSRRASRQAARKRHRGLGFAALGILTIALTLVVAVFVTNRFSTRDSAGATTWSTAPYAGGPRLAVDRTLVDEGPVAYGQKVTASYRLKNVGDQPLTLQAPTVETVEGC